MIKKRIIREICEDNFKEYIFNLGAAACPVVRELVLPRYEGREVVLELFEKDSHPIGLTLFIQDERGDKVYLVSNDTATEPDLREMFSQSSYEPKLYLCSYNLDLSSDWKEIMEGNYYIGIEDLNSIEEVANDDVIWKIYPTEVSPDQKVLELLIPKQETPIAKDDLFREWLGKNAFIVIAYIGNKPVGMVAASVTLIPVANFLYIREEYRGQGLATQLLFKLQTELKTEGYDRALAMSPIKNQKVYTSAGFKAEEQWRGWIKQ